MPVSNCIWVPSEFFGHNSKLMALLSLLGNKSWKKGWDTGEKLLFTHTTSIIQGEYTQLPVSKLVFVDMFSISQAFSIVKISTKDIKYRCAHIEQFSNQSHKVWGQMRNNLLHESRN